MTFLLFVVSAANTQAATFAVPFTHLFNNANSLDDFTIVDNNHDSNQWSYDTGMAAAVCAYNDFGSANDWLISPSVTLEAGKTYVVEYLASAYTNNGETVSISLGQGATVAAMTTTILDKTEFELPYSSSVPVKAEFTVNASGDYNIGLHMTTASLMFGGKMYVKSFSVKEITGNETVITPAACQLTLTVTSENTPYSLNAKVKTPATDTDGNALDGLKKVELLRDGVVIFSVDNPYTNSTIRTDDENIPEGKHVYTAYAYSLDGVRGEEVTKEISFGYVAPDPDDKPLSVTDVVAIYNPADCKATITWTAPTKGTNGEELNGEVTYIIRRKGASQPLATGVTSTTFVDDVDLDNQVLSAYYITAVNEAGNSSEVKSNDVFIGKPYDLPFAESAANGVLENAWQITRTGSSRWGASDLGSIAYDNDRGYITFCPLMEYDRSTITSGYINVENVQNPSLRFHYFYVMPGDDFFDVYVKVDDGEPVKAWSFDYEDDDATYAWMEVTLPLKDIVNGGKYIQIAFDAQMGMPQQPILYIDDITVIDRHENDLKVSLLKAPRTLKPGENRSAIIRIDNIGENDFAADSYQIKAIAGDKCISTTSGPKMKAGQRREMSISDLYLDVFNEDSSIELSFVLDVEDEDASNNSTEVVNIEVKPVYVASPVNLKAEGGDKTVLTWEAPVAEAVTPQSMTESFEDAPSFTIDDFDEWAVYDGLNTSVYGLSSADGDVDFPNTCAPQAWTVIDWSTGLFYDSLKPSTGDKMMAAFSHSGSIADSWLISPELSGEEQTIGVVAKAGSSQFKEVFDILYSTDASRDLTTFIQLEDSRTTAKTTWMQHRFELPEGTRYFAIHCISNDALVLLIDDVTFIPEATGTPCTTVKGYNVYRNGQKVNDTLIRDLTFTDGENANGNVYNVTAVYTTDSESRPSANATVDPSAIRNTNVEVEENELFTITGQRATSSYQGVVITKGKKILK